MLALRHVHESDIELDPPRESIDLVETLVIPLWRSRLWIVAAVLFGIALGAFQAATQPNTYDSTGKLLVRAGAREEGTAETRVGSTLRSDILTGREAVMNELHLLSNPRVYEAVVRRVGPDRILAPYDPTAQGGSYGAATRALHKFQIAWFRLLAGRSGDSSAIGEEARVAAATLALQRALHLRAEPGSSVLTITCTTTSPRLSAQLVDAFIAEALVHHQVVFASDSSLAFLDEQVSAAEALRSKAEERLAEYRVQCGIFDADIQRSQLLADKQTLEGQLNEEYARIAGLEAMQAVVEGELVKEGERWLVPVERALMPNPAYSRLQQRIFDLRLDLVDLEGSRDRTAQQVESERSKLQQQILTAEIELAQTPEFLDPGMAIVEQPNPRYVRLRERLDSIEEELIALRSSSSKRSQRLAQVEKSLVELEQCTPLLGNLENEARQSNLRLEGFLSARLQVGVLDKLDEMNLINLRPLQSATVAATKSGPRRGRSVMLGGMLGIAAGLGLALLRPGLDRRLRSPEDVRRFLGNPVLGVVPETLRARRPSQRGSTPVAGGR